MRLCSVSCGLPWNIPQSMSTWARFVVSRNCEPATEAMRLRTRYAFLELNLTKLMTEVFMDNPASRRALEKNRYKTVGVHRHHFFTGGTWHDVWIGEVLRDEWSKLAEQAR